MSGDGERLFWGPVGGWGDGGKKNGFLGVPVADEGRRKYFMGVGKAEGRGSEAWGESPVDAGR